MEYVRACAVEYITAQGLATCNSVHASRYRYVLISGANEGWQQRGVPSVGSRIGNGRLKGGGWCGSEILRKGMGRENEYGKGW